MAERDEDGARWAQTFIVPTEQVIKADGTSENRAMYFTVGSDRDTMRELEDHLRGEGHELRQVASGQLDLSQLGQESSSHFFSSSKWHAPWNPEGPKKNWRVDPPADGAHLN